MANYFVCMSIHPYELKASPGSPIIYAFSTSETGRLKTREGYSHHQYGDWLVFRERALKADAPDQEGVHIEDRFAYWDGSVVRNSDFLEKYALVPR